MKNSVLAGKQWLFIMLLVSTASSITYDIELDHGQGEMAGGGTQTSIILQSRLTGGDKLINGDVPGREGVACFEVSEMLNFEKSFTTEWKKAVGGYDYIIKQKLGNLKPGNRYYYRLLYGANKNKIKIGNTCTFRTLDSVDTENEISFVVVTGMNYYRSHKNKGKYPHRKAYDTAGYPALKVLLEMQPDFFVGTGDNVYYDEPSATPAVTVQQLRKKYHEQFVQPLFVQLFAKVPTYWEKDDHDYRFNDSDPHVNFDPVTKAGRSETTDNWEPSAELGAAMFREQLPVVDPDEKNSVTYKTHRVNKLLQIWLVEGREHRSPNAMVDGPKKSIWGVKQKAWLKKTLLESDAVFKILISPTPMVGPDAATDVSKRDSHVNIGGFRHEADEFFKWLGENDFLKKGFYIVCGDRHWQYHSIHPSGFEEFCCGAFTYENSTPEAWLAAGSPTSTDPEGKIRQPYFQPEKSGGFLSISVGPACAGQGAKICFTFYDENGKVLYEYKKVWMSVEKSGD